MPSQDASISCGVPDGGLWLAARPRSGRPAARQSAKRSADSSSRRWEEGSNCYAPDRSRRPVHAGTFREPYRPASPPLPDL